MSNKKSITNIKNSINRILQNRQSINNKNKFDKYLIQIITGKNSNNVKKYFNGNRLTEEVYQSLNGLSNENINTVYSDLLELNRRIKKEANTELTNEQEKLYANMVAEQNMVEFDEFGNPIVQNELLIDEFGNPIVQNELLINEFNSLGGSSKSIKKTKKPVSKKPVVKKPSSKKPLTKKSIAKKPLTKKPVTKKPASKK